MSDWEDEPPTTAMSKMSVGGSSNVNGNSSGSSWPQNTGSSNSFGGDSDSFSGYGRGRGRGRGRGGSGTGGGDSCFKCGESGHFSRECPSGGSGGRGGGFGGGDRKPMTCYNCQQDGHMSKDCPNENSRPQRSNACFRCKQEGHMSRDCPNEDTRPPRSMNCYKCKQDGHMARDCTNEGNESGGGGGFSWPAAGNDDKPSWGQNNSTGQNGGDRPKGSGCFKCGEEGHMSRECPKGGGDGEKKKGCFKCGDEDHMARDCTKPPEECLDPDRKPPVTYIPTELTDDQLFNQGISKGINFKAYEKIRVKISGDDPIPPPIQSFQEGKLRSLLLENCLTAGYEAPTPIQKYAIPIIKAGRDLMACAQTGSGKTAAFLLPILHNVLENNLDSNAMDVTVKPTALIISPTRELAIQIYNQARKYSKGSVVKVCVVYGGTSVSYQHKAMQKGCHILVCTPGRLVGYMELGYISYDNLKYLVLDEADRMLDMGFKDALEKVVKHSSMNPDRQTLMFSATFAGDIQQLAKNYLKNYVFAVIGMVGAANQDVKQSVISIEKSSKRDTLLEFLKEKLDQNTKEKILVFVETKRTADFIAAYLSSNEVNSTSIHGDRFQSQREEALSNFRYGIRNVLVATAVAARGLDISGVGYVVNYDMPKEIDEYVHRIGRTGRVGNQGNAVSYFDEAQDAHLATALIKILADAEQEVPDWLKQCTTGPYADATSYGSSSRFGARDIRTKDSGKGTIKSYQDSAAEQFGNNAAPAATDGGDEEWD